MSNSLDPKGSVALQAPLSMGFSQARLLKGFAISFSRGSSQPRDQNHVSYIAGRFFTTELKGSYVKKKDGPKLPG